METLIPFYEATFVTLDEQKKEVRNEINSLDDIFTYSDLILKIAESFNKS